MNYYHFQHGVVLLITGKDAPRYLNARLSNDIKALGIGKGCLAAALTAQGRTEGFFTVLRVEESKFVLLCDWGDADKIKISLMRFAVADRVTVSTLFESAKFLHVFNPNPAFLKNLQESTSGAPLPREEFAFVLASDFLVSARTRGAQLGYDLVVPSEKVPQVEENLATLGGSAIDDLRAEAIRLKYGLPSLPNELNEETLFAEAGIAHAVSFKKGCYVGQEVIEKVDARGRLPRQIVRISFSGNIPLSTGCPLHAEDGTEIGSVTSFAYDPAEQVTYCFASIRGSFLDTKKPFMINQTIGTICT